MKGQILEWQSDAGLKRGLFVAQKQIESLNRQGRCVVIMLDENFTPIKNEKGGNIIHIVYRSKTKVIGFQD